VAFSQTVEWIKTPLGKEAGLVPRHIVRWGPSGDPAPHSSPSPLSAHAYCGQTVGLIKMKLGIQVGLGPGHIVLDGDPAPLPKKGADSPIVDPYLLWRNG